MKKWIFVYFVTVFIVKATNSGSNRESKGHTKDGLFIIFNKNNFKTLDWEDVNMVTPKLKLCEYSFFYSKLNM